MAFQLSPDLARFLASPLGAERLHQAAHLALTPASTLADIQILRANCSAAEASALVEQTLLRRRAKTKFALAEQMLFIREALEQATDAQVAQHRARRFQGLHTVADLGCSIGGDSLALGQVANQVFAFDLDPVRLQFASHNAAIYNLADQVAFINADVGQLPLSLGNIDAFFADPARRGRRGQRVTNPRHYQPPLNILLDSYQAYPFGVKVAPSLDFSAVPQAAEIEVVSLNGEVKEAVLWFNQLATPNIKRRATLLPSGNTLTDMADDHCTSGPYLTYLYEPDPAVIRAGLVQQVGAMLGLVQPDPHIAYLSGDVAIESPYVKTYQIEATLPIKPKAINQYLKQQQIGPLNLKQRGTGITLNQFANQIKSTETGNERTLILTRHQNDHVAFICKRLQTPIQQPGR